MSTADDHAPSPSELVFDVLKMLMTGYQLWGGASGVRMADLSGSLQVSDGRVGGAVEYLVSEGLVDRRNDIVRLTARGVASFVERTERR